MEALVKEGLVRNIGLSNFSCGLIRDIMNYAQIKPTVLQVEMHPYGAHHNLLKFCRQKGIACVAYSNLGAGSYLPLGLAQASENCLEDKIITDLASTYKKSPAQIVLRWALQRGTGIVPKSC
jgi:D-xylose reductase